MSLMKEWQEETFDAAVSSGSVMVDFRATWCGPCNMLMPVLEQLAEEWQDKAVFGMVDVDQSPALAARYAVSTVPTLLFFKDGELVGELVGMQSKKRVGDMLAKLF